MGYFKSRHLFLWLLFLVLVFSFMFVVRTSKASVATIQWQCNNGCIADNVIDGQGRPHVSQILTGLVPGGTVTSNSITVKDAMLDLWQASFYPFCKNSKYFIEYTLCHPQPRWSGDNLVWTAAGDPVPHVALYIYSNGTWQAGFYHNDGWGNGWYRVYGTWMVSGLPTPTPVPTPTPTPVPTPTPTPGPNPTPTPTPNPNPTPTPVPTNTPLPPPPVNPPVPTGYCDGPCPVTGSGYYVNVTVSSAYKPTPTPESTPLPLINNDTDGGQNYFLKGTVFFNGQNRTDYCSSASTLNEFFYADNSIRSVSYVCPNGCFDGACAPGDASEEVLGAAITPTPTPVPTPTPLPKIAFHFLAVTCQPASAISGNQAAWYRDMTGARYRQFKNSPNFPAYSPKPVTPQEIPAGSCSPDPGWTFTVSTDRDQRQNITRLGPSGADGAVAFSFVNLTSAQQGALLSGGQLVVSATAPSGRVFGVFRCYMDALYGDNSEKIAINRSSGMPADVYCIAYGLSPVSKPVFQVSAVRTAPKATPKPTPVHSPRPTPPPTPSATATPETTPEVLGAATSNGQQGSCNGIVPSQSNDSAGLEGSLSSFMNSINRIMFTLAFGLAGGIFLLLMFAYIERGRVK